MRYLIIALALLLGQALPAQAQLSLDIGGRGFNIGINMPVYPRLVLIPGYPVYYDPDVNSAGRRFAVPAACAGAVLPRAPDLFP